MPDRNWEQEYHRILADALGTGKVQVLPSRSEKRRHPRFKLRNAKVIVTEEVQHDIVDLSISGLAFYSARTYAVGERIMVSLRQIIAIGAEVLGSDALDGPDAPAPYRIRCRFVDPDYGLRFLVMAVEMGQNGIL